MRQLSAFLLAALVLLATAPGWAAETTRLGYLSQTDDPRYVRDWGYARVVVPPPVTTVDGATMAISDLAFVADAAGLAFDLDARTADGFDGLSAALTEMVDSGEHFVVLDLNDDLVGRLAEFAKELPVTLVNATAPADALRSLCIANLLHSGPSDRMGMDAMVQYLRAQNWTRALVLVGEEPRDKVLAEAFARSAARLRIDITDTRSFTLAANPQRREQNNIKLLTGGSDYDVVFVADTRGEFGRYIPYATSLARPVIGSIGFTAEAWHWAFERDGATQVNSRFDKMTAGRKMTSQDWAVWIAVKAIIIGYAKTPSHDYADITAYMRSDRLRLDGSKGVTLNFREWNGQLRMPILLGTSDAVIAVAPLEGYLHKDNTLDTLGVDRGESECGG